MAEKLIFKYDSIGDILYINKCQPYPEQESEELGDDIIIRHSIRINEQWRLCFEWYNEDAYQVELVDYH